MTGKVIKHGGLLINGTKIYITKIQGLQGERLCRNEDDNGEVVDEGKERS